MTEQTEVAQAVEAGPRSGRGDRRWLFLGAVLAAVAVVAAAFGAYALVGDDDSGGSASGQIAAVRQACQQWMDDDTASAAPGPRAGWCDDLAGWMSGHMGSGDMPMRDGRRASREALGDTCVRAMGADRAAGGDVTSWCDRMAGWMYEHEVPGVDRGAAG